MAVGGLLPVAHDWDSRYDLVNDGTNKVSAWTDQSGGLTVSNASSSTRPLINTALAPGKTLVQMTASASYFLTGTALPDLYSQARPFSLTMRVRFSQLSSQVLLDIIAASSAHRTSPGIGVAGVSQYIIHNGTTGTVYNGPSLGLVINAWYTIGVTWFEGVASYFRDGAWMHDLITSSESLAPAMQTVTLGNRNVGGNGFRGYYTRLKLYAGAISAAQHAQDHATFSSYV
jgi:hypothetical protein